jgi:DNA-binding NtrC family response regulator
MVKGTLSSVFSSHTYTILVAEPDQRLQGLECHALSRKYHIIPTASAEETVRIAARRETNIDLLLAEVRLHRTAGWELPDLHRLGHPNLKVVYLSSSLDAQIRARVRPSIVALVDDSFRPDDLRQAVHDVLEGRPNDRLPNLDFRVPKPFREGVVS